MDVKETRGSAPSRNPEARPALGRPAALGVWFLTPWSTLLSSKRVAVGCLECGGCEAVQVPGGSWRCPLSTQPVSVLGTGSTAGESQEAAGCGDPLPWESRTSPKDRGGPCTPGSTGPDCPTLDPSPAQSAMAVDLLGGLRAITVTCPPPQPRGTSPARHCLDQRFSDPSRAQTA